MGENITGNKSATPYDAIWYLPKCQGLIKNKEEHTQYRWKCLAVRRASGRTYTPAWTLLTQQSIASLPSCAIVHLSALACCKITLSCVSACCTASGCFSSGGVAMRNPW